jgi:hypothetical protein
MRFSSSTKNATSGSSTCPKGYFRQSYESMGLYFSIELTGPRSAGTFPEWLRPLSSGKDLPEMLMDNIGSERLADEFGIRRHIVWVRRHACRGNQDSDLRPFLGTKARRVKPGHLAAVST